MEPLLSLNLNQLLLICQRDRIPILSHISECVLRATIQKRILEIYPNLPPIMFDGGPLTMSLILEVGIGDWTAPIETLRELLHQHGVPGQYLTQKGCLEAIAALIYEFHLPVPASLFYKIGNSDYIYAMSLPNFRDLFHTYSDISPEEYLYSHPQFDRLDKVCLHQTLPNLLAFARTLPVQGVYFETKAGVIYYILQHIKQWKSLETLLDFFSKIHENAYPGRKELLIRYFQINRREQDRYLIIPSNHPNNLKFLLACPPVWFEEDLIKVSLGIKTDSPKSNLIRNIRDNYRSQRRGDITLWSVLLDSTFIYNRWDPIYQDVVFDPGQELTPSRQEIAQIIRANSKEFQRISIDYLLDLTQWILPSGTNIGSQSRYYYIREIRTNLDVPEFKMVFSGNICPNRQDSLLDDFNDSRFALTYGTFTNFVCYSVEELTESFVVNDNYVFFRDPIHPQEAFPLQSIQKLITILFFQNPNQIPGYLERIVPLRDKIALGVGFTQIISLEIYSRELRKLSDVDRNHLRILFENLFEAGTSLDAEQNSERYGSEFYGRYQRTWKGPGTSYPMLTSQTGGCDQTEIDMRMTPSLNNMVDQYNLLSDQGKELVNRLPMVDYSPTLSEREYRVMEFQQEVRGGNFCVGYGSALMVYTGYFYLKALGVEISDFEFENFQRGSTHR